ncbi:MAG: hypothetical protein ACI9MC_004145 [Kiritimatiellia bacterium]|jgi:hypothetical protein
MRGLQLGLVLALSLHCADGDEFDDSPVTEGVRVELPRVQFNKWTDFLTLQAGLTSECTFLDPTVDDRSTVWPPLQVFWVIYDKVDDVKDGVQVSDVYFVGDSLSASDFPIIDDKAALGFKFLPPAHRSLLSISNVTVHEGQRTLSADLGAPISIRVQIDSSVGDGCSVRTSYCPLDEPCDEPLPLGSIYMELNGFNLVRDVQFRAPGDG